MNSSGCFQAVNSHLLKQLDRKIEKESATTRLGSGHAALPEVEVPFSIVRKISTRNLEKIQTTSPPAHTNKVVIN